MSAGGGGGDWPFLSSHLLHLHLRLLDHYECQQSEHLRGKHGIIDTHSSFTFTLSVNIEVELSTTPPSLTGNHLIYMNMFLTPIKCSAKQLFSCLIISKKKNVLLAHGDVVNFLFFQSLQAAYSCTSKARTSNCCQLSMRIIPLNAPPRLTSMTTGFLQQR